MFFDEVKKARWHPDKILVSWDVGLYEFGQEVVVESFFLSLKDPGHDPGVWWFFLLLGAGWSCCCCAGCRAGDSPGFRCVLPSLQIMMKIKILNSIKTKSIISFCRKSC